MARPRAIEFSATQLAEMAGAYQRGSSVLQLSVRLGVSAHTVRLRLREQGVAIRPPHRHARLGRSLHHHEEVSP